MLCVVCWWNCCKCLVISLVIFLSWLALPYMLLIIINTLYLNLRHLPDSFLIWWMCGNSVRLIIIPVPDPLVSSGLVVWRIVTSLCWFFSHLAVVWLSRVSLMQVIVCCFWMCHFMMFSCFARLFMPLVLHVTIFHCAVICFLWIVLLPFHCRY